MANERNGSSEDDLKQDERDAGNANMDQLAERVASLTKE